MKCVSYIPVNDYAVKILLVITGIIILGFGISLSVIANVIMNSGEAFVKAVSDKTKMNFGNIKVGFDICCVVLSVLISFFLFKGKIVGAREGTVLTAVFTGFMVKFFVSKLKVTLDKILCI